MSFLTPEQTALVVVDVQEKLFPLVERGDQVAHACLKMVRGAKQLGMSITATEQYPEGLGATIPLLRNQFESVATKTRFSAADCVDEFPAYILVGIEAHICILQTARDLLERGKEVVVLADAISSRSMVDFSCALDELRGIGARVSSVETILFELLRDAKSEHFKPISAIVKHG